MNKFIITESQMRLIQESINIDEVKLPDFVIRSVKEYKTSLGDHPSFPPDDETRFEEKILKKRYYELLTNVKKIDGTKGDVSKQNLINILKDLTIKCKSIEEPIKKELEKICFEYVHKLFNLNHGDLNLECVITDDIKMIGPVTPKKMVEEFDDIEHVENLNKEIIKRRLVNSLVQGASTRLSSKYNDMLNELYTLDYRLLELYNNITAINEYLTFIKEQKPTEENIGGEVSVNLTSDEVVIKSSGIIFPVLLFETIKGIMELLSSHGLPEKKEDSEYVISKSDFKLAENWDRRLGVGLWDILMNTIGYDNFSKMPIVFTRLVSMPELVFQKTMREIFGLTKKGKKIIQEIIEDSDRDIKFSEIEKLSASESDDFFTPEELIGEVISETDTTSAGDYTYDTPMFTDPETANHKNMITRSIQDGLNEEKDYYDFYDESPVYTVILEFISDKKRGVGRKQWNLIPAQQYHNALKEFMQYGQFMRFPTKYIEQWTKLITKNVLDIYAITALAGHSSSFPYDDFLDAFGFVRDSKKYNQLNGNYIACDEFLNKLGFYDWANLPDGSDAWSDYGLKPLFKLIKELEENTTPEQQIVTINKVLDVIHQRGDLASAFIEGGKSTLYSISNESKKISTSKLL